MNRKKLYTAVALFLLVALYVTIFCFSAEDAESSSAISGKITQMILDLYYRIVGVPEITGGGLAGDVFSLEGLIRKLAHFAEYMCMGFLSYSLVTVWNRPCFRGSAFVVLQVFLSAALDEFHQYFVPGRNASFRDVLIDTAGGIAGILVILTWMGVRKGWLHFRNDIKSSEKKKRTDNER